MTRIYLYDEILKSEKSISTKINEFPVWKKSSNQKQYKGDIRDEMIGLNKLIFEKEHRSFNQKQKMKNDSDEVQTFVKSLIHLQSLDNINNPGEYVTLQKSCKNTFDQLLMKNLSISHYFNMTHFLKNDENEKDLNNENLEKEGSGEEDKKNLKKNLKKNIKKPNMGENNIMTPDQKLLVPFRTKEECVSRSTSKPTFTNKVDLIRTIERLGLKKHFKKPLSTYTKEELCAQYFIHAI